MIVERSMTNYESLQLVKDYTEGKARAQVEFYLASTNNPTFEGLIQDLAKSFQSGEDKATIKRDFYSRMQLNKESVDNFADVLQLLARNILNVDPVISVITQQVTLPAVGQWPKRRKSCHIHKANS